jgi:hypothetical protein
MFTKEGAAEVLGLTGSKQILYYIKRAKKLGLENISKMIGGVEYFDAYMLDNPKLYIAEKQTIPAVKIVKGQLSFDFNLGDYR